MARSRLVVFAGQQLFDSFFTGPLQRRLTRLFHWSREGQPSLGKSARQKLSSADAAITTWDSPRFSDDLLEIAPHLRIISHCGGEVKSRFSRALFDKLTITASPAPMAQATAELGAVFLLYCARNVDFYREEMRQRSNQIYQSLHLHGGTDSLIGREVAMIGFGRIGRALVDMMRGFDLRWLVYDPYASKDLAHSYPVKFVGLAGLLPRARFLLLTAALTAETRGILNRDRLKRLPDGATIINIARGGLLDLDALTKEVKRGRLRCALDVTDPLEPLPVGHPLRNLPGAIVTPHMAGSHRSVRHEMAQVVIDDLERFFLGEPVKNRVTTSMLDQMT